MEARPVFAGPICRSKGYSMEVVEAAQPGEIFLTNGIALELFSYKLSNKKYNCEKPTDLVYRLCGYKVDAKKFNCVRTHLTRLNKTKKEKRRRPDLERFLSQVYLHFDEGYLKRKAPKDQEHATVLPPAAVPQQLPGLPPSPPLDPVSDNDVVSMLPVSSRFNSSANSASENSSEESSCRAKRKKKQLSNTAEAYQVDFSSLSQNILLRYTDHFGLPYPTQHSQALALIVAHHFSNIPVDETSITTTFLQKGKKRQKTGPY